MGYTMLEHFEASFEKKVISFGNDKVELRDMLGKLKAYAESIKGIRQSQLRSYYRKIMDASINDVIMIKVPIAYGIGRASAGIGESKQEAMIAFLTDMDTIIDAIQSDPDLKCVQQFMQALLAYHKMFGQN